MTTDNICFYLQNRLIQTSQTGGQWYSDTSPFRTPWSKYDKTNNTTELIMALKCFIIQAPVANLELQNNLLRKQPSCVYWQIGPCLRWILWPRKTHRGESLSTVKLLNKVACFVKRLICSIKRSWTKPMRGNQLPVSSARWQHCS